MSDSEKEILKELKIIRLFHNVNLLKAIGLSRPSVTNIIQD